MGQSPSPEKQVNQAKKRIRSVLTEGSGICRGQALAADLMVPWKIADLALKELAIQYECTLRQSGGDSSSEYVFQLPLKQRAEYPSIRRQIQRFLSGGWKGALFISLSVITLFYGLFFLLILAALGQGDLRTTLRPMKPGEKRSEFLWQQLKSFLKRFNQFVVGPSEKSGQPHSMMEAIYIFLAKNGGVLSCADVMALSGCDYDTADHFITWLMLVDKGSIRVTDEGVLIYVFPEFREDLRHKHKRSGWFWQRESISQAPKAVIQDNHTPILFSALAFSSAVFTHIWMTQNGVNGRFVHSLFGEIPIFISSLCLILPILRTIKTALDKGKHLRNLLRIDIMRVMHDELRPYSIQSDLSQLVRRGQAPNIEKLREQIPITLKELRGERSLDSSNNETIDAPTLRDEWTLSIIARDRILAGTDLPGERVGS